MRELTEHERNELKKKYFELGIDMSNRRPNVVYLEVDVEDRELTSQNRTIRFKFQRDYRESWRSLFHRIVASFDRFAADHEVLYWGWFLA